jgi:hypothetical protein
LIHANLGSKNLGDSEVAHHPNIEENDVEAEEYFGNILISSGLRMNSTNSNHTYVYERHDDIEIIPSIASTNQATVRDFNQRKIFLQIILRPFAQSRFQNLREKVKERIEFDHCESHKR